MTFFFFFLADVEDIELDIRLILLRAFSGETCSRKRFDDLFFFFFGRRGGYRARYPAHPPDDRLSANSVYQAPVFWPWRMIVSVQ